MLVQDVKIGRKGLSMDAAVRLMRLANSFPCLAVMQRNNRSVNAKSLLGILSLPLESGDGVRLIVDGQGEETAMENLVLFFEKLREED
ncbi:MAG: HPr family phosphocarrier protein [Clostridia bacterium]|nr:HPr family phosphocarrier protein [Clostridia bacterium]